MKNLQLITVFIVIAIFSHCKPSSELVTSSSISSNNGDKSALIWQQTSAEYVALCHQAFNVAQWELEKRIAQGFSQKPIVVMDLDETVMDNSPYNGKLLLTNTTYTPESWMEWTAKVEAELVPGAYNFIIFLMENQIDVRFISNRNVSELDVTMENIATKGLNFESNKFFLKSDGSSKAERRSLVSEDGEIIMLIGDNLADFHNAFEENKTISNRKNLVEKFRQEFGRKFIVLPNVMYGDWVKASKNDDPTESINDYDSPLKYIKSY